MGLGAPTRSSSDLNTPEAPLDKNKLMQRGGCVAGRLTFPATLGLDAVQGW